MYALACSLCYLGARFPAQRALKMSPVILRFRCGRRWAKGAVVGGQGQEAREAASDADA